MTGLLDTTSMFYLPSIHADLLYDTVRSSFVKGMLKISLTCFTVS